MQEGSMGFQVVAFSPDGVTLATGGIDRNITIWDVAKTLDVHKAK
jgi:WD40 repeat protein